MEEKDFIINVGPQGTFKPSGSYQSIPADIDAMFSRYENDGVKKITLFFHGGLVDEKTGLATAIKMGKHFSSIGQTPICFVWETGLMETVTSNIGKVSETKLFGKLIKILVKKLSEKLGFDLAEGRGAGVSLTNNQIEVELSRKIPFENYTQTNLVTKGRGADASANLPIKSEDLEGEFKFEIESDFELIAIIGESKLTVPTNGGGQSRGIISTALLINHVAKIAFRVITRFVRKRDHDLYPTIIEELLRELYIAELGAWVWNNMKVKSSDMWKDNSGISGINLYAGRFLFDKLSDYHKRHPDVQVNLVGHSAGSIAICNLFKMSASSYPNLIYDNIIFMAPACRISLFRDEIVKHQNCFKTFRMFTMTDKNEKHDLLVPYFYTHSLLYLISGILEDEGSDFDSYILGLERNIKATPPYDSVNEIVEANKFLYAAGKNRIAFSQTDGTTPEGLRTQSLSHGGFDDDDATINSIKFMLS
jgi:hypothetical protein